MATLNLHIEACNGFFGLLFPSLLLIQNMEHKPVKIKQFPSKIKQFPLNTQQQAVLQFLCMLNITVSAQQKNKGKQFSNQT